MRMRMKMRMSMNLNTGNMALYDEPCRMRREMSSAALHTLRFHSILSILSYPILSSILFNSIQFSWKARCLNLSLSVTVRSEEGGVDGWDWKGELEVGVEGSVSSSNKH